MLHGLIVAFEVVECAGHVVVDVGIIFVLGQRSFKGRNGQFKLAQFSEYAT